MKEVHQQLVSIIIVSYNSEQTIDLCLLSINKSHYERYEIIVVDNNSSDGTVQKIRKEYPNVNIIEKEENLGFSAACNEGVTHAEGEYLLFLNPDCLISENLISRFVSVVESDHVGGIGPMLIDGSGKELAESARNIPTLLSGLYHMLGWKSKGSGRYYANIEPGQLNKVDVLSGACLYIKRSIFHQIGKFDERYFMYGEDVDLCATLKDRGFQNYCDAEVLALHFKGESTNRRNWNYSFQFFNSIQKYLSKYRRSSYSSFWQMPTATLLLIAAFFSWLKNQFVSFLPKLLDLFIVVVLFLMTQFLWSYAKGGVFDYFGYTTYWFLYVFWGVIFVLTMKASGIYDLFIYRKSYLFKVLIVAGMLILLSYGALHEGLRFSRIVVCVGVMVSAMWLFVKYARRIGGQFIWSVVTDRKDVLLNHVDRPISRINFMASNELEGLSNRRHRIVFDLMSLNNNKTFNYLKNLTSKPQTGFMGENLSIFVNRGKKVNGTIWALDANYNLSLPLFVRQKRIFDIGLMAILFIPISILKILTLRLDFSLMRKLILGEMTFVGYSNYEDLTKWVPQSKRSILNIAKSNSQEGNIIIDNYSRSYSILDDAYIVLMRFRELMKILIKNEVV